MDLSRHLLPLLGNQVITNVNSPRAVAYSAIIYALRCLVDDDVPLNAGCLQPIDIIIPKGKRNNVENCKL